MRSWIGSQYSDRRRVAEDDLYAEIPENRRLEGLDMTTDLPLSHTFKDISDGVQVRNL